MWESLIITYKMQQHNIHVTTLPLPLGLTFLQTDTMPWLHLIFHISQTMPSIARKKMITIWTIRHNIWWSWLLKSISQEEKCLWNTLWLHFLHTSRTVTYCPWPFSHAYQHTHTWVTQWHAGIRLKVPPPSWVIHAID